MIENAVQVNMARAIETGKFPRLVPMDTEAPANAPNLYGLQANGVPAPSPVDPMRQGLVLEVQELRSLMFARFEDIDQQLSSLRQRVSSLESHVFGDGPRAVSGR